MPELFFEGGWTMFELMIACASQALSNVTLAFVFLVIATILASTGAFRIAIGAQQRA